MKHGTYYACTKYREGSWPNAKYRKSVISHDQGQVQGCLVERPRSRGSALGNTLGGHPRERPRKHPRERPTERPREHPREYPRERSRERLVAPRARCM